jgi:NAD(P)-dependent dehydrogenase (short-subunit alcohol dehydrogenase family)
MINPMELTGKKILVTGASSGIGRAIAILLSNLGASVILSARSEKRLNETLELMEGNNHHIKPIDLFNLEEIDAWLGKICKESGPLNGLVHCAGAQSTLPLQIVNQIEIDKLFQINVSSAVMLTKSFIKKKNYVKNDASVVYISSIAALCGEPAISIYSATKGALISLAKSLSIELARNNIRVNCVAPGHVETEMADGFKKQLTKEQFDKIVNKHPLGIGTAEDVANSVAFLLSDISRWITGTTLIVDGGYSAQ